MLRCLGRFTLCCFLISSGCFTFFPEKHETFRYPEGAYAGGELRYINEVPILSVQGTPEEMGEQIAVLALRPGKRIASYPRDLLNRVWAGWTWDYFLHQGKKLLPQFPTDYRRE